jgi:hypothetical protein
VCYALPGETVIEDHDIVICFPDRDVASLGRRRRFGGGLLQWSL